MKIVGLAPKKRLELRYLVLFSGCYGCLNPYTSTFAFEGVQFNRYHKWFVFN